jgi:hypothetical protein
MQYKAIKSEEKWFLKEYKNYYGIRYVPIVLPTLHEHSDYWAKLEGKVIEDGELDVAIIIETIPEWQDVHKEYEIKHEYAIPLQHFTITKK